VCDAVVEGEGTGQGSALLDAEWCEVWVGKSVACCVEIVIALCVLVSLSQLLLSRN